MIHSEQANMDLFFKQNIQALGNRDSKLADRIATLEPDHTFKTIEAASGALTAFQSTPDGRTRYFHSRIDPLEEGAAWAEAAAPMGSCAFILGMGLGYHVRSLVHTRTGIETIHVIEPSYLLFRTALETLICLLCLRIAESPFGLGTELKTWRS